MSNPKDPNAQPVQTYKVVIIGDGGTGKTTYVKRHMTGEFTRQYIPTLGAEVRSLKFFTNFGLIQIDAWDTAGQEKFGCLRDGYYIGGNGSLLFFDLTSRMTYKNVPNWHRDFDRVCGSVPQVLIGNKVDVKDRKIKAKQVTFHRKKNMQYVEISCKSNYNIEKPWLFLLRQLTGYKELLFVEEIAVLPAEIPIDHEAMLRAERERKEAESVPLPLDEGIDEDI